MFKGTDPAGKAATGGCDAWTGAAGVRQGERLREAGAGRAAGSGQLRPDTAVRSEKNGKRIGGGEAKVVGGDQKGAQAFLQALQNGEAEA